MWAGCRGKRGSGSSRDWVREMLSDGSVELAILIGRGVEDAIDGDLAEGAGRGFADD